MTDVTNQGGSASGNAKTTDVDFVALKPGQMVGRYEIVAVLGQGGFGITYRARDGQLGRDVAIKEYLPSALAIRQDGVTVLPRSTKLANDFTWGRQRFVDEGRTLASLEHAPAIVQVFDFLEANGTAYIVMKLMPGETLEHRIKQGRLSAPEIDRILWPILDGLEKVHAAGFLHRDIKPANILLDGEGHPTLIDFGAARAAMAGRTTAMTAIFTPGYAAAEQMTSAKQGPWTDIYGIAATIYHAIAGAAPPSAFDRMLDDGCEKLARLAPEGFSPGLLIGVDAGLAVKATDRPQSIAGWRPILGQTGAVDGQATVALAQPGAAATTIVQRTPTSTPRTPTIEPPPSVAAAPAKRGAGLWIAIAAAVVLLAGGGGYYVTTRPPATDTEAERRKAQDDELAKLRQEKADREKAEADASLRRQVEEETRQKIAAEQAEKRRQADEDKRRALQESEAQRKAQDEARRAAEASETALQHTMLNRQRIQAALNGVGYSAGPPDGILTPRTREAISAWQKARGFPVTGFLDGPQHQALMREGAVPVAKFDEEQKKADETRKAADEARRKAEAEAEKAKAEAERARLEAMAKTIPGAPAAPRPAGSPSQTAPPASANQPSIAAVPAKPGVPMAGDGTWQGTYHCGAASGGGSGGGGAEFTMRVRVVVTQGVGTWQRPGEGRGIQSLTMRFNGQQVLFQRVYSVNQGAAFHTGTLTAHFDGNTVSGGGQESNSGGRHCDVSFTR